MSDLAQIIDGRSIAQAIEEEVTQAAKKLKDAGIQPHLATLQVGTNPATDLYIRKQKTKFARLGIHFTHLGLDPETDEAGLISHIHSLNQNPTITGIMVTTPLPNTYNSLRVREAIQAEKDVEGLSPTNMGNLLYDRGQVGPCTALAVFQIIEACNIDVKGMQAVVVGHSNTVGKPVTLGLLNDLATTTTCHVATKDLKKETLGADLLVVAVGKSGLITEDMVKDGVIVIDVGINEVQAEDGTSKIVGDVDFENVSKKSSRITPVPGGVGPVTVAMLAKNTILCAEQQLVGRG